MLSPGGKTGRYLQACILDLNDAIGGSAKSTKICVIEVAQEHDLDGKGLCAPQTESGRHGEANHQAVGR